MVEIQVCGIYSCELVYIIYQVWIVNTAWVVVYMNLVVRMLYSSLVQVTPRDIDIILSDLRVTPNFCDVITAAELLDAQLKYGVIVTIALLLHICQQATICWLFLSLWTCGGSGKVFSTIWCGWWWHHTSRPEFEETSVGDAGSAEVSQLSVPLETLDSISCTRQLFNLRALPDWSVINMVQLSVARCGK